jgi:amino acid transporter
VGRAADLPLAFVNYLRYFLPELSLTGATLVKVALVGAVAAINLVGVRSGGRTNDVPTIAKLVPLGLLIVLGLAFALLRPTVAQSHLVPFAPPPS